MKYFPIYLWLAGAAMLIAAHFQPGSGWGFGGIAFAGIGAVWAGVSKYRAGKWFTTSAGGK